MSHLRGSVFPLDPSIRSSPRTSVYDREPPAARGLGGRGLRAHPTSPGTGQRTVLLPGSGLTSVPLKQLVFTVSLVTESNHFAVDFTKQIKSVGHLSRPEHETHRSCESSEAGADGETGCGREPPCFWGPVCPVRRAVPSQEHVRPGPRSRLVLRLPLCGQPGRQPGREHLGCPPPAGPDGVQSAWGGGLGGKWAPQCRKATGF